MSSRHELPHRGAVFAAGALLGLLLWHVAGHVGGDGFFHLARIQKLLAFGDLSLGSTNEFPDGGLHPGYAFPLWHGFLALIAKVSGADPVDVVLHGPTVLAPLAVLVAYEAGWALFRRAVPAATSAAAGVALVAMAPGHAGALTALALPATASRQLLVPAALALALEAVRRPTPALLATAAAASLALVAVHPTYAVFLWLPFAGFVAVRWLWERRDAASGGLALAALVAPAAVFVAWLLPVVADTASVNPDASERDAGIRPVRGAAARHGRPVLRRPRALRPHRRHRGRGPAAAPARGARVPPPLGGVRRRGIARRVRRLPRPLALHAVLRRRLALAVAAARRVPAAPLRARGWDRRPRASDRYRRCAARARGRNRLPARVSRRLRLHARARRAGVGDVDRRGRRRRRPRARAAAPPAARAHGRARLRPSPGAGVRARAHPLEPLRVAPREPALAGPRGRRPGRRPGGRDRVLVSGGQLPPRRRRAGPRLRQPRPGTSPTRSRTARGSASASSAASCARATSRSRAPAGRRGSSSTATASRSSRRTSPSPSATSAGCSTGSERSLRSRP